MNIRIFLVPYDSGFMNRRQGLGPACYLDHGLEQFLAQMEHNVEIESLVTTEEFLTEVMSAFELNRILARHVREAVRDGWFPLVLTGNCHSCLGVLAGIGSVRSGLVWLDAHGEFNTPDTTVSGLLDGMPLALATGRCWKALLETIPGFQPVPDEQILLIGARDLDEAESHNLDHSRVTVIRSEGSTAGIIRDKVGQALVRMAEEVEGAYLHLDLDAVDLDGRRANRLHPPGGLKPDLIEDLIGLAKQTLGLKAATISTYDPAVDHDQLALKTAFRLIKKIFS
jgi:arginase